MRLIFITEKISVIEKGKTKPNQNILSKNVDQHQQKNV